MTATRCIIHSARRSPWTVRAGAWNRQDFFSLTVSLSLYLCRYVFLSLFLPFFVSMRMGIDSIDPPCFILIILVITGKQSDTGPHVEISRRSHPRAVGRREVQPAVLQLSQVPVNPAELPGLDRGAAHPLTLLYRLPGGRPHTFR